MSRRETMGRRRGQRLIVNEEITGCLVAQEGMLTKSWAYVCVVGLGAEVFGQFGRGQAYARRCVIGGDRPDSAALRRPVMV